MAGIRRGAGNWLAVALLASACAGTTKPPMNDAGAQDAGWESRLADTSLAVPFYSLRFIEQGPIFQVAFVAGAPGANCDAYTRAVDAGADLWALEVVLPSAQIGAYPILPPVVGYQWSVSDGGTALAFLEHQDATAGADYAFFAIGGAVTIKNGPEDGGAEAAGEQLAGSLTNVVFPSDPIVLGACRSIPAASCICTDLDGNPVSVCDGGPAGCCVGTGASLSVSVPLFEAAPCPVLCSTDPGIDPAMCSSL